ncbi:MAG TPA: acyl-CoA dehydrogenase family protein, partial [Solirubrobacterales bacterium]|nr:acyl-CoA dehydrogenase family protein [Solirubrobacterales bacterium]
MTTTTETDKTVAERSMGVGLRALNWLAGSDLLDRIRMRKGVERALFQGTKGGFRSATVAGRTFKAAQQLGKPARQKRSRSAGLFDVTPDDEQQMFQEGGLAFAADKIRPAALEADAARETPPELLSQAAELGVNMLGVPEQLGGVMHEQSAVTSVLIGEALAHGDMGIAYAALAPGAVATAIGLWGTAEQEATYLPAFTGEDVPAAALAILEPRPLFDPLQLETKARRDGTEWVLEGAKSLLARAKECELFVIAAEAEGLGPALFVVESGAKGLVVEDEPAMGLRPAATGRLLIDGLRLPATALLGEGKREDYVECINRARIAWCSLAVGTSQAVLDYVIPYVNERQAFGEPISNRQGVAFAVSDIGIESGGMRLAT